MQARSTSSIRVQLARDLHDSLAQDLVAIGYKLDLLTSKLPQRYRSDAREIRFLVTQSAARVRQELFALRAKNTLDPEAELSEIAKPLSIQVNGDLTLLAPSKRRIVNELVRNAATHSKGRNIKVEVGADFILVSDDGQGLFGVSELIDELDGELDIRITSLGTELRIEFK